MSRVVVGKITGAHGVRGEVKVMPYTTQPLALLDYQPWSIPPKQGLTSLSVKSARPHGPGLIVDLNECHDRELAKALVGSLISIDASQLPPLDRGFYWVELVGLEVYNLQNQHLGTIDSLFETGANDVIVVKGDRERLIPYVLDHIIQSVDLQARRMVVDWGLDD